MIKEMIKKIHHKILVRRNIRWSEKHGDELNQKYVSLCGGSAKSRKQCLISSRRPVRFTAQMEGVTSGVLVHRLYG